MRLELAVAATLLAACSENSAPKPAPAPSAPVTTILGDAGVTVTTPKPTFDPSGMHLDDDGTVRPIAPQPVSGRPSRPIDVTLRSSPPGAVVAVDGTPLGNTPAFWNGAADGREHEFTFTLRGHSIARYRFVPVSSGVIHARLDPIAEEPDAGVQPPPEVMAPKPSPSPSPVTPPAPPPTVVKPVETPPAAAPGPVVDPTLPPPAPANPTPAPPAPGPSTGPQP